MPIITQLFFFIYFLGLFYSAYHILFKQKPDWSWRFSIIMFVTWLFWPVALPLLFYVDEKLNG
jgi:hypothetical protein